MYFVTFKLNNTKAHITCNNYFFFALVIDVYDSLSIDGHRENKKFEEMKCKMW